MAAGEKRSISNRATRKAKAIQTASVITSSAAGRPMNAEEPGQADAVEDQPKNYAAEPRITEPIPGEE